MLSINTNISSYIAQRSLNNSTQLLNQAIERMTTGYKLNHASDNAANYSISTNQTTKLSAYKVAEDNASMGLDLLTTANDSLNLISDHLTRIRDLAMQAENGTYGEQSLKAINSEINARVDEIERLYNTTEYNGIQILNGNSTGKSSSVYNLRFEDLGITDTTFYINEGKNSVECHADTIGEFIDVLRSYGMNATLTEDGTIEYVKLGYNVLVKPTYCAYLDGGALSDALGITTKEYDLDILDSDPDVARECLMDQDMNRVESLLYGCSAPLIDPTKPLSEIGIEGTYSFSGSRREDDGSWSHVSFDITIAPDDKFYDLETKLAEHDIIYFDYGYTTNASGEQLIRIDNVFPFVGFVPIADYFYMGDIKFYDRNGCHTLFRRPTYSTNYTDEIKAVMSGAQNGDNNMALQVGIYSSDESRLNMDTSVLLSDFDLLRAIGTAPSDLTRATTFDNSLSHIDELLSAISSKQVEYGAYQNRLESALDEISTHYENLASSRSTLRDADIAKVSSEYIRQQILQQASATLMATANQSPSIALQLI